MIVVIGAGVAGLASGLALAMRRVDVCVIDRHGRPGQESSTHNSGVIHAGLYHPPASLKTRLCHEGRARLYAFCRQHGVPHVRCGKLIVAAPGEEAEIEAVARSAAANGVTLEPVDAHALKQREPHVAAAAALWSADTGWIDADAYVRTLVAELQRHGGVFLNGTPVAGMELQPDGTVDVVTGRERIRAEAVINAAGTGRGRRVADGRRRRVPHLPVPR
jgi:D-amino-acid oxidase